MPRPSTQWPYGQHLDISVPLPRCLPGATLGVAPFARLGEGPDAKTYAMGLADELLTALPRFKEIQVFGRETSEALSSEVGAAHVRGALGADYLLTGGVRLSGNHVRVTARVLDTQTNAILWSQDYDDDLNTQGLMAIQTDVANKVATTVAQPYGIISTAAASRFTPNDLGAYGCTLQFYAYRADLNAAQHAELRSCLESAIARYPSYATAWAMLSMIYLDEHRFKYNPRNGLPSALERSLQAARRAVQLDPDNTRGLQALMTALFFNKQPEESLRVGEEAVTINPNDTELLSEFGTRLALSGQWGRGKSMLEAALARNPGRAGYYHGIVALADYMQKDNLAAVAQIRQADQQKFPLFRLVAAIVYQQAGMPDDQARASSFAKLDLTFSSTSGRDRGARAAAPGQAHRGEFARLDYARLTIRACSCRRSNDRPGATAERAVCCAQSAARAASTG